MSTSETLLEDSGISIQKLLFGDNYEGYTISGACIYFFREGIAITGGLWTDVQPTLSFFRELLCLSDEEFLFYSICYIHSIGIIVFLSPCVVFGFS